MNKDKVLHVSYGGIGSGGVAAVILSIVQNLHQDFDFHCIVFRSHANKEHIFEKYGKLHRINCYYSKGFGKVVDVLLRPFKMTWGCYKVCKQEGINTIHCHNGYEEAYFLLGAKLAGVKKRIAHSHNSKSPIEPGRIKKGTNGFHRYLINKLSTHKVGCSMESCEDFFRTIDYEVIYNSVDFDKYYWKRNEHEGLNIVHVGRYDYPKNQSFILDVIKSLSQIRADLTVRLVGFGPDEQMLKNKVNDLELQSIVSFVDGRSANIHEEYANADCMIFPSCYEGFGIVLIESQASGCYVFSSDVVPSATNVGMMTRLSLNSSPVEWANTIYSTMSKCESFSPEVLSGKIDQFDVNIISNQYKRLYEK